MSRWPTWLTVVACFTSSFGVGSLIGLFLIRRKQNAGQLGQSDENAKTNEMMQNPESRNLSDQKNNISKDSEEKWEEPPMPEIHKFKNNSTEKFYLIDFGTTTVRAGPPSENPSYEAPNIVGFPKGKNSKKNWDEFRKGNDAFDSRKFGEGLQIVQPVQRGEIQNFEASEFIWNDIFASASSYYGTEGYGDLSILMTAAPASRSRICEIFFEEYSIGKLLLQSQDFLAIADNQVWSGISVHLGGECSSVVPIYNGCAIESARKPYSLWGKNLTEIVSTKVAWDTQRQIIGRMDDFTKYKISNSLKTSFTCVPDEFGDFVDRKKEFLATISDRPNNPTEGILNNQLLCALTNDQVAKCGEVFFQDENDLSKVIYNSIESCDSSIHEMLLKNVVVHGGTAAIPGLQTRLQLELETIASRNNIHFPINVVINEKPNQAAWRGACNVSTVNSFPDMFITGELYHEVGPSVCQSYYMS